jgi:glycosyltransferase involved in cell wall biosynthesis
MPHEAAPSSVRLVCLTTSSAFGGAETSLLTMLAALRRLEPAWEVTVITPSQGPVLDRCRTLGITAMAVPYPAALAALGESGAESQRFSRIRFVTRILRATLVLPRYVSTLRRVIRDRRATVIHSNGLKAHICGALAKQSGTRLVWQLHDYVRTRPFTAALLRRLVARADAVVTNSDSVLKDAAAAFGSSSRLRRAYNAVDLSMFRPDGPSANLATLSGLPPDSGCVRIGLVAVYARWKGHDVFIDAIAQLPERDRIRAYIIGAAVYETTGSQWSLPELQARVAARGLSNVIGFTGHIDNVAAAMRSLDVVVHASTQPEPFGMVIAEGMASGRTVVAVRDGGAAELFEDGINGVAYSGDAQELANRLRELIADPSRRARLGVVARAAACERFSPERMARELRQVYLG